MGTELGEAKIPIRATLDKLDGDLNSARGKVERMLDGVKRSVQSLGTIALGGLGVALTAVGGVFAFAAKRAIEMNSTLETSTLQFETLMGDADRAREHVASLFEFAKKTPFETGPIIEASRLLRTFGGDALDTEDNLRLIGDAAAATNAPIDELGFWTGRLFSQLQAGKPFGEAAARLSELAVISPQARAQMEELQAAGASADEVWAAFTGDLGRFSGAMEKQASTWKGLTSTIKDAIDLTIAKALKPFFELAEQGLAGLIDWLSSPEIEAAIDNLTVFFENLFGSIAKFPALLEEGFTPLEAFGEILKMLLPPEMVPTIDNIVAGIQGFIDTATTAIKPIVEFITQFVTWKDVALALAIAIASVVLPIIGSIASTMLPIIAVGALLIAGIALLRTAWETDWGGIRTSLTSWWNETGSPIFTLLKEWLAVNIPVAIQILSDFWTNTLQPAIQTVWAWISGTLIPFLSDTLFPWLQEKIPAAIQTLSDFWTNTLQPALQDVWDFLDTKIIPVWQAVIDILGPLGEVTITVLAAFWQNVLLPALTDVYNFLNEHLTPAFTWLKDNVIGPLGTAIIDLRNRALAWLLTALENIKNFLDNFELPDWLQSHSPTPFEVGLLGITNQLEDLDRVMSQSMLFNPSRLNVGGLLPMMAMAGVEGSDRDTRPSYSSTTTIYTSRDPMRILRASRHLDKLGETL
ncbi:MAG: hypothetical protein A2W25_05210 [candidate division Zixibacteria bacterium RBG_16_53_22]|nr:MAG: hypothetical protein A2W25_05210 [candidate division Zixibacteria bacterium RBG_16_53_22]